MRRRQQPVPPPALRYVLGKAEPADRAAQAAPTAAALGAARSRAALGRTFPAQTHPAERIPPFYKHSPPSEQFWKKGGWVRPCTLRLPPSSGGSGPPVCNWAYRGLSWCIQNRP